MYMNEEQTRKNNITKIKYKLIINEWNALKPVHRTTSHPCTVMRGVMMQRR